MIEIKLKIILYLIINWTYKTIMDWKIISKNTATAYIYDKLIPIVFLVILSKKKPSKRKCFFINETTYSKHWSIILIGALNSKFQ